MKVQDLKVGQYYIYDDGEEQSLFERVGELKFNDDLEQWEVPCRVLASSDKFTQLDADDVPCDEESVKSVRVAKREDFCLFLGLEFIHPKFESIMKGVA